MTSIAKMFPLIFLLFYIRIQLIYNVMLISGLQQSDSIIYTHVSIYVNFFSYIDYYRILGRVPWSIQ